MNAHWDVNIVNREVSLDSTYSGKGWLMGDDCRMRLLTVNATDK